MDDGSSTDLISTVNLTSGEIASLISMVFAVGAGGIALKAVLKMLDWPRSILAQLLAWLVHIDAPAPQVPSMNVLGAQILNGTIPKFNLEREKPFLIYFVYTKLFFTFLVILSIFWLISAYALLAAVVITSVAGAEPPKELVRALVVVSVLVPIIWLPTYLFERLLRRYVEENCPSP